MERDELVRALRRMMPETGSLHCLGCGYEHNCSLHGCAIIREAMEEIMRLAVENDALRRGAGAPDRPLSQAERDALLEWPPDPLPNPPLTLEELREMDGGPSVWVCVSKNWEESGILGGWRLVKFHTSDDRLRVYTYDTRHGASFLAQQDYGISWLAYRRKPEEGTPWQQ